ncbi:DUF3658 domain-containing protein [Rhizobium tubonense]|nr:DUF3658 domain-containing protein [Rhizobium tubonense]
MKTTHVVPGDSAAGSIRQALRIAGRDDALLCFGDDLSCGPIGSSDPSVRTDWWHEQIDWPEIGENIRSFWAKVDAAEGRLVVWFGRHSARELAFRLAWAWHMVERPYYVVDVTGLRVPVRWGNGTEGVIESVQAVSIVPSSGLATLFGSETVASIDEDVAHRKVWVKLMAENAPFRVLTPTGLVSAPSDYFDPLLLAQASSEWRKIAYLVGNALGSSYKPYIQIGDIALHHRVVVLIEQGKLIADGDPSEIMACRVRLPE